MGLLANNHLGERGLFAYLSSRHGLLKNYVPFVDETGDGIADFFYAAQGTDGTTRKIRKFNFNPLNPNAVDEIMETSADFGGAYFLAILK